MKTTGCSLSLFLAAGVLAVTQANASLLGIFEDADSRSIIPALNSLDTPLANATGIAGAHVVATSDIPIELRFEFLFKDASLVNTFWVNGQEVFNGRTSSPGDHFSMVWRHGAQALDFKFITGKGVSIANDFESADQNDGQDAQNFAIFWDGFSNELLLGLDDGGANRDGDYNDLLVRITSFIIPEPASLALFSAGLTGLCLARRRQATPR